MLSLAGARVGVCGDGVGIFTAKSRRRKGNHYNKIYGFFFAFVASCGDQCEPLIWRRNGRGFGWEPSRVLGWFRLKMGVERNLTAKSRRRKGIITTTSIDVFFRRPGQVTRRAFRFETGSMLVVGGDSTQSRGRISCRRFVKMV